MKSTVPKFTVVRDCVVLDTGVEKSSSSEEVSDSDSDSDELLHTRYMYVTTTSKLHIIMDEMNYEKFSASLISSDNLIIDIPPSGQILMKDVHREVSEQ